jgi:ribosomal protein L37E
MLSLQNGPKKKKQLKQQAAPRSHHVRQCARCGFEAKKIRRQNSSEVCEQGEQVGRFPHTERLFTSGISF